ncbi:MAG: glycosyltransferase [Bacteroidaceae bacterium]|nr:glycosyltransferase [Bacteroidaceae bacterium]
MQPKLSVLVPCYNVEKYIRQCIESIINQSFSDLEIICLNDGSTDHTLDILKEYEAKDKRITIIDKINSGYGATMNIGIDKARAKYIAIVESDDYIEKDMFHVLYHEAETNNLDIARCLYRKVNEVTGKEEIIDESPWFYEVNKIFKPINTPNIFFIAPSIWAMIYRKDFLIENNIRFLETPGASYQDASFNFKVLSKAQRMKVVPNVLHNYRINENSSVCSSGKIFCVCDEDEEIHKYAKNNGIYEELKEVIGCRMFGSYSWNFDRLSTRKHKLSFAKRWSKELRQMFKDGEITPRYFSKDKIFKLWLVTHCPYVFYFKKKF